MKSILFVIVGLLGLQAYAGNLGPAGCGLGHQIFNKDNQILAATTNGSTYNQTFGITSGTSGCEQATTHARLETFVEINRVALSNDAARGEGETLVGLSQILSCESVEQVGSALKANFGDVFHGDSSQTISRRLQSVLKSNDVHCANAG